MRLPDYVFEWIGRAVAERLDILTAEHKAELAEARATVASLRADNLELRERACGLLVELKSDIARRLDEIKPASDISDAEFERRVEKALELEAALDVVEHKPAINVTVPITLPKRGKEVTTVEHDETGRIKRSIKEEVDG